MTWHLVLIAVLLLGLIVMVLAELGGGISSFLVEKYLEWEERKKDGRR